MRRLRSCWRINCAAATAQTKRPKRTELELKRAHCLEQPGLSAIGIGGDIRWRLDGIGAKQLSRAAEQGAHFVELLLQRRISHVPTLPRLWQPHNSLAAQAICSCRYAWPVAIFGRKTARQRLRRATRDSLAIPAFSSPIDCTPWVIGGLWPAELSTIDAETSTLGEYLKADLQRITSSANDELKMIRRAGMAASARQAQEARVINEARARAVRRVESTVRHLRMPAAEVTTQFPRPLVAGDSVGTDIDKTQVIPAVTDVKPTVDAFTDTAAEPQESTETDRHDTPVAPSIAAAPLAVDRDEPEVSVARHRAAGDDDAATTVITPEPAAPEAAEPLETVAARETSEAPETPETVELPVVAESHSERLQRLLAFVVRQEPRLNWAVGDHADGTTVLVTDLAHGWIPPGITLPAGVRLLEPGRRVGKVSALLGETTRIVTYTPGDSVGRPADFAATESSVRPRELPTVEDLGWELGPITHWRDGLPRMVYTLAKAAAAGTGVVEEEVDLLRVHLDTARYQLMLQYPDVEPALLLNCLLLAATEGLVTGDSISANYHFAWFQKLSTPPASRWTANP